METYRDTIQHSIYLNMPSNFKMYFLRLHESLYCNHSDVYYMIKNEQLMISDVLCTTI